VPKDLLTSMSQRLDYHLKGEVKLNNMTFGTLPFERSGNFALPKFPPPARPRG
jgi:hypothetical protein